MKTAIVTGGSRGIGAGIVRVLSKFGWKVVYTYTHGKEAAIELQRELNENGGDVDCVKMELKNETSILSFFENLDSQGISFNALINNAGITGPKTRLEDLTSDVLREVCDVNLIGTILCTREAVKRMSTKNGGAGGAIVNISSTGTHAGNPNQWIHYAATKGAIDIFTRGLAREIATEGVRVNAVSPGLTITDPKNAQAIYDRLELMRHELPMARPGTTEELGEAVEFLCSERAAYITGTVLPVAGGR